MLQHLQLSCRIKISIKKKTKKKKLDFFPSTCYVNGGSDGAAMLYLLPGSPCVNGWWEQVGGSE